MPEHFELKKKEVAVRGLVGAGGALLSTLCVGKCAMTGELWGLAEHSAVLAGC